ncbi:MULTISPECIES: restriction endonuclease [Paenibacillus]|uniref:restriction endonuclease n=1 Tax=Paenibacillus TaxID=44249 RepID=UPI00041E11E7|nr:MULTISPECIES: restriction endonuclease [Paenibacillus]KKC48581.1 restriction endonuclease [Paenibacillus sp. D9]CDN43315.1 Putative endonuclease related to Holliday junction resolvase [Paenibacillus sp. P22]
MARTYRAEGRQLANLLRGVFVLGGLLLYFNLPGLHWGFFFGIVIVSVLFAEILGTMWTSKRRSGKQTKQTKRKVAAGHSIAGVSSKKLGDKELIQAKIETLSGTDFERLMELYYTAQGYSVQRVGGSGDHEVDLILKGKEGYKIAVQCKRWKRDVGNDIVLRLKAGKQVHGCYDAWIVTTSNFTRAAKEAAERLNIKLINGLILQDKLTKWKRSLR